MSKLQTIQRGRTPQPPRLLIYGVPKIGKSTFAASATQPIFIQTEDGLDEIECEKFPLAASFDDVLANLHALQTEEHDYSTLAIDSLDWLERLIWASVCQRFGCKNIEKVDGGYARGYTHAMDEWRELIRQLDILRSRRRMQIILIAHAKVEKFEDPEAPTYDRYSPRIHKHASAIITEWCDAVLFATRRMRAEERDSGFNKKRGIAHAIGANGGERILRVSALPSCLAGNRYGLNDDLPLSWDAFYAAVTEAQTRNLQPVTNGAITNGHA